MVSKLTIDELELKLAPISIPGLIFSYTANGAIDEVSGSARNFKLDLGHGNQSAYLTDSDCFLIDGQQGDDSIVIETSMKATVLGGIGNDYIGAYDSTELCIDSGDGHDSLDFWELSQSTVLTGAGNDCVNGWDLSNLILKTGTGHDAVTLGSSSCIDVDLGTGNNSAEIYDVHNANIVSGNGCDVYTVDSTSEVKISSGDQNDRFYLSNIEASTISGGNGKDYFFASEYFKNVCIAGGNGADILDVDLSTANGNLEFLGGEGSDTLNLQGDVIDYSIYKTNSGLTEINITTGTHENMIMTYSGVEKITLNGAILK